MPINALGRDFVQYPDTAPPARIALCRQFPSEIVPHSLALKTLPQAAGLAALSRVEEHPTPCTLACDGATVLGDEAGTQSVLSDRRPKSSLSTQYR
jgi:hypothetical protein